MNTKKTLGVVLIILTLAFPFRWAFFDIGEHGNGMSMFAFLATVALLIVGYQMTQGGEPQESSGDS